MIRITDDISIAPKECDIRFVRSGGPGGQHVNKVSTAVQLIYDIRSSSLPENIKNRILQSKDRRISREGKVIIKSSKYRSQRRNKEKAIENLVDFIKKALQERKRRKPTRPHGKSKLKRLAAKKRRGEIKELRRKIINN